MEQTEFWPDLWAHLRSMKLLLRKHRRAKGKENERLKKEIAIARRIVTGGAANGSSAKSSKGGSKQKKRASWRTPVEQT